MSDADPSSKALKAVGVRRVMGNLGVLLGGRAVNAPLSLVHVWIATHIVGTFGFGMISMLYAFARAVGDVTDFQSWQTVLKYGLRPMTDNDRAGFQRVVAFSLLLDGLGGAAGLLCGAAISLAGWQLLGWPADLHLVGLFYCLSIPFMSCATATGLLRLFDRFDLLAVQGVAATVTRLIGTAALAVAWLLEGHVSFRALASVWVLAEASAWATISTMAFRELHARGLAKGMIREGAALLPALLDGRFFRAHPGIRIFALGTNLNATLTMLSEQLGTLTVGAIGGPVNAGYYRAAHQIATGIAKPASLLQTTVYPEMARLWRGRRETKERAAARLNRLAVQVALIAGATGTALLAATLLVGKPLLHLLIGVHGAAEALPVALWLLAAEVVTVWGLPLEPLLFTLDRAGEAILARLLDCAFLLPGLIVMTGRWGLSGAGPAALAAAVLLISLQLLFVLRKPNRVIAIRRPASCP